MVVPMELDAAVARPATGGRTSRDDLAIEHYEIDGAAVTDVYLSDAGARDLSLEAQDREVTLRERGASVCRVLFDRRIDAGAVTALVQRDVVTITVPGIGRRAGDASRLRIR